MEIDREGLNNARITCGTIMDALSAQAEDLKRWQHPRIDPHLELLTEAANMLNDAESDISRFLYLTEECWECDGIMGDAERAEVVYIDQRIDLGEGNAPHRIIHQSCFRTNVHEIA